MGSRAKRAFRPVTEGVESRCLATAQVLAAAVHAASHPPGGAAIQAARHPAHPAQARWAPNGGLGLIRLGLPGSFLDYGVVTLWNNTRTTVSFAVSASTFHNGQYFPFIFRPGQVQSFFAPVVGGNAPRFQVRFNQGLRGAIPLPYQNTVFESPAYRPSGTAGWPYAIGLDGNGYYLTPI